MERVPQPGRRSHGHDLISYDGTRRRLLQEERGGGGDGDGDEASASVSWRERVGRWAPRPNAWTVLAAATLVQACGKA